MGASTSEKMWIDLIASEDIQNKINDWLGNDKKLKSTYEINISPEVTKNIFRRLFFRKEQTVNRLFFRDKETDTLVSPKDMGLGISQVLPILISCNSKQNTRLFLEQPELHLHPAIQSELADEFIRSYKERGNEFMIETHSEHLLLRIMKRMRYTAEDRQDRDKSLDLTPDDVCLLYVDNNGKTTYINELELDDDGSLLDPWPNGFFEEGHKERFE
jgi:predicted ATPase